MDVDDPATGQVRRRVVIAVAGGLLDEAHEEIHVPRRSQKPAKARVLETERDVGDLVAEQVAGQRQLGKDDEPGAGALRLVDGVEVEIEVLRGVAERR
jgi:hypothetical protein